MSTPTGSTRSVRRWAVARRIRQGATHMGATISVRNVAKGFHLNRRGHFVVLQDISFDVAAGEFLVLVGPSGCGKTTLLDLIGGLTEPDNGSILVAGRPIAVPGPGMGIVVHQYPLFPRKSPQRN